jgi:hypothetical protein
MPVAPQAGFPTVDEVMQLARSIVNDTFPGIAGAQGRIFTNDAQFTLPFLNSAQTTEKIAVGRCDLSNQRCRNTRKFDSGSSGGF